MSLPNDASSDQSNCPDGYYRRANGMLHQASIQVAKGDINAIDVETLSQLESMPKEALISLIQRVCGARWGELLLLSSEATYQAIIDKSAYMALTTSDVNAFVKAAAQYMERTKGKVADRVEQTTHVTGSVVMISKDEVQGIINGWLSGGRVIEN